MNHSIIIKTDARGHTYCTKCLRNVWPVGNTVVTGIWPNGEKAKFGGHKRTSLPIILSRN